jgi:hypothetical protein
MDLKSIFLFLCLPFFLFGAESFLLNNLQKAKNGDYVVISQGKSYTLFHIMEVKPELLTVQEITIPASIALQQVTSWPAWVQNNAPCNTSWVQYQIDASKGELKNYYSFTKKGWFTVPEAENFLQTLLKLDLLPIPPSKRKRVGSSSALWEPKMVINGQIHNEVHFNAWVATWPKDGGPLSEKTIEIYLPEDSTNYPAYFPYWLQTQGVVGQAKVRIVDSGRGLTRSYQQLPGRNSCR